MFFFIKNVVLFILYGIWDVWEVVKDKGFEAKVKIKDWDGGFEYWDGIELLE